MSSDFTPTTVQPHQKFRFQVTVFNAALGDGWQNGTIQTDSSEYKELNFEIRYRVEPSASLFPDTFLVSHEWQRDKSWPLKIDFDILDLGSPFELVKPMYIEPNPKYSSRSQIQYSISLMSTLEPGGKVVVQMDRGEFEDGQISDGFIVVAEGRQETLRFPVAIAGNLQIDSQD